MKKQERVARLSQAATSAVDEAEREIYLGLIEDAKQGQSWSNMIDTLSSRLETRDRRQDRAPSSTQAREIAAHKRVLGHLYELAAMRGDLVIGSSDYYRDVLEEILRYIIRINLDGSLMEDVPDHFIHLESIIELAGLRERVQQIWKEEDEKYRTSSKNDDDDE